MYNNLIIRMPDRTFLHPTQFRQEFLQPLHCFSSICGNNGRICQQYQYPCFNYRISPLFTNYGFHPRFNISIPTNSVNPSVETCARTLHDVHDDLSLELCIVGDQYTEQANRHRLAAPTFAVGDMVWLLRQHIATTHPCAKLDYKKLGPFCIIERINQVTFWLALPPTPG